MYIEIIIDARRFRIDDSPQLAHISVLDVHAEVAKRRIPVFVGIARVDEIRYRVIGGVVTTLFCAIQSLLTSDRRQMWFNILSYSVIASVEKRKPGFTFRNNYPTRVQFPERRAHFTFIYASDDRDYRK